MDKENILKKINIIRHDIRKLELKMRHYPTNVRNECKIWILKKKSELKTVENILNR